MPLYKTYGECNGNVNQINYYNHTQTHKKMCRPVLKGMCTLAYRVQANTECVATGPRRNMDKNLNNYCTAVCWDTLTEQNTNRSNYKTKTISNKVTITEAITACYVMFYIIFHSMLYQAGSCWCYRQYAAQVAQHRLCHQALALEGLSCSALTPHHRMWCCTHSRQTIHLTNNPLWKEREQVKRLMICKTNVEAFSVVHVSNSPNSDLDKMAGHSFLSVWSQHRGGRPLCPGSSVSLLFGHAHRKLSRGSMNSTAHKLGTEVWCTPEFHFHTHWSLENFKNRDKVSLFKLRGALKCLQACSECDTIN